MPEERSQHSSFPRPFVGSKWKNRQTSEVIEVLENANGYVRIQKTIRKTRISLPRFYREYEEDWRA